VNFKAVLISDGLGMDRGSLLSPLT